MAKAVESKNKQENKVSNMPYVSADTFLESATNYQLDGMQQVAFKVKMKSIGKYEMPTLEDFVPYLEEYLGIEK
ncbi:MAG: hypothetical protein [Bacteriophage sp.]|nr:MAG: hypothetical protein [Bacteriophage sp.]